MEHTGTIIHFLKTPFNRSFPLIAGNLFIQNRIAESTLTFDRYQNHPRERTLQGVCWWYFQTPVCHRPIWWIARAKVYNDLQHSGIDYKGRNKEIMSEDQRITKIFR